MNLSDVDIWLLWEQSAVRRIDDEHTEHNIRIFVRAIEQAVKAQYKPVYQVGSVFDIEGSMEWCDSDEHEYSETPDSLRRILYAIPKEETQ